MLDELAAIWLFGPKPRISNTLLTAQCIQRKRGDQTALLPRAHVQGRPTGVRKITLASSALGSADGWQCG